MCILLGIILVIFGWVLIPATNFLGIGSACAILVIYGFVSHFGFSRIRSEKLVLIGAFSLLAGTIFASEVLLEYAILPKDKIAQGFFWKLGHMDPCLVGYVAPSKMM